MTGRLLWLHLRARRVPAAAAGLLLTAVLAGGAADWLVDMLVIPAQEARKPVAVLAPMLAAGILVQTLGGSDEWLERSTPVPWRRWRAVHLLLLALVPALALSGAILHQPEPFGPWAMCRGAAGMIGVAALAAAVIGSRAAWIVVLLTTAAVYLAAPALPVEWTPGWSPGWAAWWAWPMQPTTAGASFWAAGLLLVVALVVHSVAGARPTTDVG